MRTVEHSDPLSIITTIHRSTSNIAPDFSAGQQREYKAAVERFAGSQGKAHGQSMDIDDGMTLARDATAAPTRMGKLDSGEIDALVLALCGLERLGKAELATEILSREIMLPAVGQGALALE